MEISLYTNSITHVLLSGYEYSFDTVVQRVATESVFLCQCALSDVWVVPVCELGTSDRQIHCRSHLGHLLHDGDCVWG